jgi:hypothetical protein
MATCLSCRVQLHLLLIGALYKDGRIHSDVENSIYKLEEAFNREVALTKGLFLPENINGIARTLLQMCVAYYGWQQTMGDDVLAHERFGFITKEMIVEKLRQLIPAGVKSREGWGCAVQ